MELSSPPITTRQPSAKQRFGWLGSRRDRQTTLTLTLMALPGIVLLFIFAYLPMVGLIIAFKDYRFADGLWGSAWVGFDNFRFLFGADSALRVTRNTLLMNSLFIVTGTAGSLFIALLMNEVYTSWASKYYQTLLFFPHFISWVIVSYFVFGFLNGDTGLVNQLLTKLGLDPIAWYREAKYWPPILRRPRSTGPTNGSRSATLRCRCCCR
jgi:putative aldouronate transport system permease protein